MKEKFVAYIRYYVSKLLPTFIMIMIAGLLATCLWKFRFDDASWFYHARYSTNQNILGYFGASIAGLLVYLFGSLAYAVPVIFLYAAYFTSGFCFFSDELDKIIGLCISFVVSAALCAYHQVGHFEFGGFGGLLGGFVMRGLHYFDPLAQGVILYTLLMVGVTLITRFGHISYIQKLMQAMVVFVRYVTKLDNLPARFVRACATAVAMLCMVVWKCVQWVYATLTGSLVRNMNESLVQFEREDEKIDDELDQILKILKNKEVASSTELVVVPTVSATAQVQPAQSAQVSSQPVQQAVKKYALPDIEIMLSQEHHKKSTDIGNQELSSQAAILEEKLSLFGIKGKVVRVHPGPVITLFEYKPDVHIKLSKILGLEDDLAMALQALSIRIIAPIPGKDVVGFEVSNKIRKPVLLSDIFHSTAWTKFKGSLPLILGEDTAGNHIVVDLASMPHVLIAGSTGSGKSVALNCMLVSLLCAKKPEELKLIIVDPKQIEFTAYEKIAHLLFPIVNDPAKALPIFKWLVMTMEDRYERMAQLGVKNIFEHHKLEQQRSDIEHMPFIVVMIDELADLMMTTGKDIEGLIARIAQMSRAAGIHMIVATQRPSVDVITGLIKVNFPNRISFKVTSKVDSRTILDEIGAERLLGKGDMLFIDAKDPHMRRVHGAYVSDKEIAYLVSHIEQQQPQQFLDISEFFVAEHDDDQLLDTDQELFQQVVDMVKDCDEVSISMIQRRFRIGFNRSARIIETLQARGLIMPSDGGKMRKVIKD